MDYNFKHRSYKFNDHVGMAIETAGLVISKQINIQCFHRYIIPTEFPILSLVYAEKISRIDNSSEIWKLNFAVSGEDAALLTNPETVRSLRISAESISGKYSINRISGSINKIN